MPMVLEGVARVRVAVWVEVAPGTLTGSTDSELILAPLSVGPLKVAKGLGENVSPSIRYPQAGCPATGTEIATCLVSAPPWVWTRAVTTAGAKETFSGWVRRDSMSR